MEVRKARIYADFAAQLLEWFSNATLFRISAHSNQTTLTERKWGIATLPKQNPSSVAVRLVLSRDLAARIQAKYKRNIGLFTPTRTSFL